MHSQSVESKKMKLTLFRIGLAFTLILSFFTNTANATLINFEDAYLDVSPGATLAAYYVSHGLIINGNGYGVVGGIGNGDPGGWNLEGTNGPAFYGCNYGNRCKQEFLFNTVMTGYSIDMSAGHTSGVQFNVTAYLNNSFVDIQQVSLLARNDWVTASYNGQFDSLIVSPYKNFNQGYGYGIDNLVFNEVSSPATLSLFGLALAGLGLSRRHRS